MVDTRSIETTFRIAASPDDVFRALTEANELMNWFPVQAKSDPREGGVVWMSWGKDWVEGEATFSVFDPPEKLVIRSPEAFGSNPTEQTWTITQDGAETVLHLVHSGFSSDASHDDEYDSVRTGWEFELTGLKHYLERHKGAKRDVVVRHLPVSCSRAEACAAILGGDPPAVSEPFSIELPGYGTLEGVARVNNAARDFAAVIPSVNDAYLRCLTEACGGSIAAILWLSCYGVDQRTMDDIGAGFEQLLGERLAKSVATIE